jgi:hypothetical protein
MIECHAREAGASMTEENIQYLGSVDGRCGRKKLSRGGLRSSQGRAGRAPSFRTEFPSQERDKSSRGRIASRNRTTDHVAQCGKKLSISARNPSKIVDCGRGKRERMKIPEGTAAPVLIEHRSRQAKCGKYMKCT